MLFLGACTTFTGMSNARALPVTISTENDAHRLHGHKNDDLKTFHSLAHFQKFCGLREIGHRTRDTNAMKPRPFFAIFMVAVRWGGCVYGSRRVCGRGTILMPNNAPAPQ